MRRPKPLAVRMLVVAALASSLHAEDRSQASGCSRTAEEAARASGVSSPAAVARPNQGFRVDGVQVDPVLHRSWLRIRRCDDTEGIAFLIPSAERFASGLKVTPEGGVTADVSTQAAAGRELARAPAPQTSSPQAPAITVREASPILVHAGDPVQAIFDSGSVHMSLAADADQQGAVGDTIQLTLRRRTNQSPDEPLHRMRGTLRADKSVEVQQ